jgi:hypothetical protein
MSVRSSVCRLFLGALLSVCISTNAIAAGWGSRESLIVGVLPQGPDTGANFFVQLASPENPDACPTPSISFVIIDGSTQLGKYLAALVMQAKLTGSPVYIFYNGCNPSGYAVVTGLWLR